MNDISQGKDVDQTLIFLGINLCALATLTIIKKKKKQKKIAMVIGDYSFFIFSLFSFQTKVGNSLLI